MSAQAHPALTADEPHRPTIYVMVWAALALIALGYLTLLAIRPDLASNLIVNPTFGSPESNQGQRAMFRALAELQDLKKTTAKLQAEIAEIKSSAAADRQRALELEARVAAAEARVNSTVPIAEASPAAQKSAASTPEEAGDVIGGNAVRGQVIDGTPKAKKEARQPPQKAIASVTSTPSETSAAAAPPPAPSPPMGLLISSGPSLDAIRLTWQLLLEGHRATLRSMEPRVVEIPGDPPAYQLIAGPAASREAAAKACERLKAKQARCTVIPLAGQPL